MTRAIIGVSVAAAIFLSYGPATAQPVASFGALQQQLRAGDVVRVATTEHGTLQGRIARIAADALDLDANGQRRRLLEADIREVARHGDSVWNGVRNGLLIGLAAGAALAVAASVARCEDTQGCAGETLGAVATGAAYGAGIGLVVDASRQDNSVIYRASSPAGRVARDGTNRRVVGVVFRF